MEFIPIFIVFNTFMILSYLKVKRGEFVFFLVIVLHCSSLQGVWKSGRDTKFQLNISKIITQG